MYTRRLLADVNIAPTPSQYDKWVPHADRFEKVVGEEALARAYFGGDVPGLDRIMAPVYGPCSATRWAQAQDALPEGDSAEAADVLANRGLDYCPVVAWWDKEGPGAGTLFPPAPQPVRARTPDTKGTPGAPAPPPSTPSTPSTPPTPPATGGSGGPHHP
jgi:hypothetical protein